MKRRFRLGALAIAALLQLAAPLGAYARIVHPTALADLCSAVTVADHAAGDRNDLPPIAPSQHDCTNTSCCSGSVVDITAPIPSSPQRVPAIGADIARPAESRPAASAAIIAAAPPRGPPQQS